MANIVAIAHMIAVLTNCSSADAERAAQAVCQTPEAIELLTTACGASQYAVGAGGVGTIVGLSTGQLQLALAGAGVGAVGALGARRFCGAVIQQTGRAIDNAAQVGAVSPTATTMLGGFYSPSGGSE